jgi:carboxyl-terminal processing protease
LSGCLLMSCGGSGSGGGGGGSPITWTQGVFQPESTFAAQCAAPRSGTDPFTGRPYPDRAGSTLAENSWLRSWTNHLYLWYSEVADQNPVSFASTASYFAVLKTPLTTSSGSAKDKFHFTYPTSFWESLSQSGVQPGYGATWAILAAAPPRNVLVAYTEPNSPATTSPANLARGGQVLTVDGVDAINATGAANVATLNAGLFPATIGETHTFSILDSGATVARTVTMTSQSVTNAPVQNVQTFTVANGTVGYMLFNDHLATAEPALIAAFTTLRAASVTDLVLDIRYNGGGYLDIASEVAYMIAGLGPTSGKTFELEQFNAKYPTTNPVTGQPLTPTPFWSTSQGFTSSPPAGQALPTLNLARVFLLTGAGTCSASESIINGLRGVNVQVIQIGSTTCGKPYAFYPSDNCGTTYFSIQMQGINAIGQGGYSDGFSPANTASGTVGVPLPGCSVADDFSHPLGNPAEGRLAAALAYATSSGTPSCPAPTGIAPQRLRAGFGGDALVVKSPWHENRIFRR